MDNEVKIDDLVWAKMKGYPHWPGQVCEPPPNSKRPKKGMYWIYFFGSCNNGWIEANQVKPYEEFKEKFISQCKIVKFKEAVKDIETFIEMRKKDPKSKVAVPVPVAVQEEALDDSKVDGTPITPTPKKPRKKAVKRPAPESSPKASSKRVRTESLGSNEENGVSSDDFQVYRTSPETTEDASEDVHNSVEETSGTSPKRFGFLGLGNMGSAIVNNLINAGHRLYIWNRSPEKCQVIKERVEKAASDLVTICEVPFNVVLNSDIIFSCLGDTMSAKKIVQGNCGVVHMAADGQSLHGKGYVEMTGIDPDTSRDIRETIEKSGGRYLEAQIQGSKTEADRGDLVMLCAGDKTLFQDCQSCLKAMGKTAFYLGPAGYATKINLILQLIKGIALAGLVEGLALADRSGISAKDLLKIFKLTNMANPYLEQKADLIIKKDFTRVEQALEHMQKDMKLAVKISDQMKQPLLMGSTSNEVYKHARRLGYDGRDAACIYMRTRH